MARFFTIGGLALPQFWIGLMLLWVFFTILHWAPGPIGRLPAGIVPPHHVTGFYVVDAVLAGDWRTAGYALRQLVLPVITLAFGLEGPICKIVRSSMVESLNSEYIRTAVALGFGRRKVLLQYALKNGLLPVLTILAGIIGYTFCGSVLVEGVFGWPGVGNSPCSPSRAPTSPRSRGSSCTPRSSTSRSTSSSTTSTALPTRGSEHEQCPMPPPHRPPPRTHVATTGLHPPDAALGHPRCRDRGGLRLGRRRLGVLDAVPADGTRSGAFVASPSWSHPFGTDAVGADIFSRTMAATHTDFGITIAVIALAVVAGTLWGSLAGFYGGLLDSLSMRLLQVMNSFPALLLAMLVIAAMGRERSSSSSSSRSYPCPTMCASLAPRSGPRRTGSSQKPPR